MTTDKTDLAEDWLEANITQTQRYGKTKSGIYFRDWHPSSIKPALILVMGYSGNSDSWHKPFLDLLAKDYRIILFDNRGTGRSIKPKALEDYQMRLLAEDLQSVADHLEIEKFHLLGYSLGGCIALEYTCLFPKKIESLILLSTQAGGSSYVPPDPERLNRLQYPKGKLLIDKARSMWEACNSMESVERLLPKLKRSITSNPEFFTSIDALNGQMTAYRAFDRATEHKFSTPVLVCTGDEDLITPPVNSRNISDLIKNSKLEFIRGCGHLVDVEKPDELARTIKGFIEDEKDKQTPT